ncbi:hypothetical protein FF011L_35310 [Roseimaritima multifibrata]|uniref:Uncharacterized protein n=1 Tax=Roseimaritima multifibrata TaxID=1930274 RepID=A0A517MIR4_9BACT|nr:hypothetical protein [Roseimaritima multifibrata]QDS94750.1 hypothetical protein FF011L_35310 [Roseimaritima multifibrata]
MTYVNAGRREISPSLSGKVLFGVRRWKQQQLTAAGPVADAMDDRVKELENQLRRVVSSGSATS